MRVSLRRSMAIQGRVLGALLLREVITRYGRHNIGLLWLFLEPMLYTLVVTAIWYFVKLNMLNNIPIVAFAVTGFSALALWRNTSSRSMTAVIVNSSLTYHRNVQVLDLVLSRGLLELVGATVSFALLTIVACLTGVMEWPADIILLLQGWLLLGWFGMALGFIMCAMSERFEAFERIWQAVQYPIQMASGIFFMVDWLPTHAQEAVLWVPMVHGMEMIRHGYFGNAVATYESPMYLIVVNMVMTLVGLMMLEDTSRKLEP
ncbi:MAG: ABC transporter permease [Alphaproteobacteria bacterium]|nr:ABC transporter permease [Alphaproteobacteria bacterium]